MSSDWLYSILLKGEDKKEAMIVLGLGEEGGSEEKRKHGVMRLTNR